MSTDTLNDYVRAGVVIGLLVAVATLALWLRSEAAAGALVIGLGAATGYLFRGRVQTTTTDTVQPTGVRRS